MSEATNTNTEVVVEEGTQNQEVQLSEIEQKALDMGWRPKEEFDGAEEDFIEAKEFVRRKPLFDKIEQINRSNKHLHQTVNALKEHYTKVEVAAYNRALKDLQAKQKEAVKAGDLEQYHELQQEISEVEDQKRDLVAETAQETKELPTEYVSWKTRNSWYQTDPGMTDYADQVGRELASQGMEPAQVLKAVEQRVKQVFKHKFENPNRSRPGAVESTSNKSAGTRKGGDFQMTEQEKTVMNALVRQGVLTKEQYIADLKKVKGE